MLDLDESLLDQITVVHGPHALLNRYFAAAEEIARGAGVRIRIHGDFRGLVELNRQHQSSWTPMSPMFDPAHSRLRADTAFWVEAVDHDGHTVATHAQRLFVWPETTLEDEVRSLRVFYADPSPHVAAGEYITITAPIAKRMTGRTMYGGVLWTHPDWRRRGLVRILPRISRAYGFTRWLPDFMWAFVEQKVRRMGIPHASGPFTVEEGMVFRLGFREEFPGIVMWMTPADLLADIAAIVAQAAAASERPIDRPRIATPLRSDHGISTRS